MAVSGRLGSGAAVMSNGLIISPHILGAQVTSLDLHFEPSAGIMAKKLNVLALGLKDFRTPLRRAIEQVIIPSIQMNFHKHGRPRWAPLRESTVKRKGGSTVPLQDTGTLREGMKSIDLWTIRRDIALLTDLPQSIWYGKVHQAGLGVVDLMFDEVLGETVNLGDDGGIPARPFVMIQPSDEILIEQVFDIWVEERIVKAGLK